LLLSLKGQEQGIMIEIDNAIKQAASSYDRVQATRKASEYALAALEAEQKKLENGKSTSFVVLQLQNDLTSARSAELRAVADYNNALAELSFREATTFERHNINWEVEKELK
jgi:outer membrane protein